MKINNGEIKSGTSFIYGNDDDNINKSNIDNNNNIENSFNNENGEIVNNNEINKLFEACRSPEKMKN